MDNSQEMTTPLERFYTFWWVIAGFVGFGLLAVIVYVVGGKKTDELYEASMATRLETKAAIDSAQVAELSKVKPDMAVGVAMLSAQKAVASKTVVPGSPTGIKEAEAMMAKMAAEEKAKADAEAAANPATGDEPKVDAQKLTVSATNPGAGQAPMQFVETEITAVAGKPIELTFKNPDTVLVTGHNLVVCKPGKLAAVSADAMAKAADPEFAKAGYVPASDDVLIGSKLLLPNQTEVLKFTITEPGDYPYVCTFPGHSMLMKGVLRVTK